MTLVLATLEGMTGLRAIVRAKVFRALYLGSIVSNSSHLLAFSKVNFSTSRCSANAATPAPPSASPS